MKSKTAVDLADMLDTAQINGTAFKRINAKLGASGLDNKVYVEIVAGLNAIGYRLMNCIKSSTDFTRSITKEGEAPPFPHRYLQEQCLFDFFVNGASAIESLSYCLHCTAFLLDRKKKLSMDEKRMRYITPGTVQKHYSMEFKTDGLTHSFRTMTNDSLFMEWKRIRNVLIHRGTPGRDFALSTNGPRSARWRVGITLNSTTTSSRLEWLIRSMNAILQNYADFLDKYMAKTKP